jgi:hypothetical protein
MNADKKTETVEVDGREYLATTRGGMLWNVETAGGADVGLDIYAEDAAAAVAYALEKFGDPSGDDDDDDALAAYDSGAPVQSFGAACHAFAERVRAWREAATHPADVVAGCLLIERHATGIGDYAEQSEADARGDA